MNRLFTKFLLVSLTVFICLSFLPNKILAYASEPEPELINIEQRLDLGDFDQETQLFYKELAKYLIENENGELKFDTSLINEETPEDIIKVGEILNDFTEEDVEQIEQISARGLWGPVIIIGGKKLSHYGNYCGKGNNGKKPIDNLDKACQAHDKCYKGFGKGNKKCNTEFRKKLQPIIKATKATSHKGAYARAAMLLFM